MRLTEIMNPFKDFEKQDVLRTLACALALGGILLISSFAVSAVSGAPSRLFGFQRSLRFLFISIVFIGLCVASYFRLKWLTQPKMTFFAIAASVASCMLLAVSIQAARDASGAYFTVLWWLCLAGIMLFAIAYAWLNYLFAWSLTRLSTIKASAIAVTGGIIMRQLALPIYSSVSNPVISLAAIGVLSITIAFGLSRFIRPTLETFTDAGSLAQLELTNPLSSLRPPVRLFVCVFLVSFTYNFSNNLGVPGLSVRRMVVVFALLALLYFLLILHSNQEDRLFSLVVLFIMCGLMIAPLVLGRDAFLAHTCLFLGSTSFSILMWLLIYGLGTRSVATMAPVFCILMTIDALGSYLGGESGHIVISFVNEDLRSVQMIILVLAIVFFAFIWLGFKNFSFSSAIRGIEPVKEIRFLTKELPVLQLRKGSNQDTGAAAPEGSSQTNPQAALSSPGTPQFSSQVLNQEEFQTPPVSSEESWTFAESVVDARCKELAIQTSLTPREEEIFVLLAHGRNAAYIMDTLTISRNTAKAHIKHIYTKLGVHSHQELLSLVETAA